MVKLLSSAFLLLATLQAAFGQGPQQRATLFEGRNQAGEFLVIPNTYVPDLSVYNWHNRANSVCVTGVWIFYVNTNYNNALSGVEYVWGANNYCTNLATVGGYVKSARFAGSPNDYRSDTFTLFKEDYFQGEEEYHFVDSPNLNLVGQHKSIIITGSSAWTVFDAPGYAGNAICLYPRPNNPDYEPYMIPNVDAVSIPHGSIRSIRKGCVAKEVHSPAASSQGEGEAQSHGGHNVVDFARGGKV